MSKAYLQQIEHYLPEIMIDNELLSREHPEWSVEKIAAKTGIQSRRYAAPDETSGDLACKAAEKFFSNTGVDRAAIDYLILCTQSPDYFLPTTACIIQDRLGLKKSLGAVDINLGCSGFVYGLGLAKGLVSSEQANNILLITSETYSKFIHPEDKKNKTLFGDAAAATLISADPAGSSIAGALQNFSYETDGGGAGNLIVKSGAFRQPDKGKAISVYQEGEFISNDDFLFMDGKAIFDFTVFHVPALIKKCLEKNKCTMEDIDVFIFHQANEFMLETVRKFAKIPKEKFYTYLQNCGNTVSSTIPIALQNACKDGVVRKGNKVLLCGFGVGLSMGACVVQF